MSDDVLDGQLDIFAQLAVDPPTPADQPATQDPPDDPPASAPSPSRRGSSLTDRERAILSAYTWWAIAWCLVDPDTGIAHAKSGMESGTGLRVQGESYRYKTTVKGIHITVPLPSRAAHDTATVEGVPTPEQVRQDVAQVQETAPETVDEVVTWTAIRRHAEALPDELRQELADAWAAHNQVRHPLPSFTHPGRDATKDEVDAARERWHREDYYPWRRRVDEAERLVCEVLARAIAYDPDEGLF